MSKEICPNCGMMTELLGHACTNKIKDKMDKVNESVHMKMIMMNSYLKDSGERENFPTGAIREPNLGRGRYDLISPIGLRNLAIHMERGAEKYSARNWELGLPLSRHLNSAIRHLQDYLGGDRSEDHLSAAVFNVFAIEQNKERIRNGELPRDLDDLPNQTEVRPCLKITI